MSTDGVKIMRGHVAALESLVKRMKTELKQPSPPDAIERMEARLKEARIGLQAEINRDETDISGKKESA